MLVEHLNNKKTKKEREKMNEGLRTLRHDLRSPLQTIQNAAYLIETNPSLTKQALQIIRSAVNQAIEMLEDPLNIIQLQEIHFSAFIGEILKNTVVPENIETAITSKHEQFSLDSVKMRRVINNLVKNAIEAMHDGGKIIISSKKLKYKKVIEIIDNGPGIPLEIMKILLTKQVTTKTDGHGIGLISCKKIVEAHNGIMSVKSKPGKTIFRISLP